MSSLINIPTYILNNLEISKMSKAKKIYYLTISVLFVFAEKLLSEQLYCKVIGRLHFVNVKVSYKNNYFIVEDSYGRFYYTNKRFTRMLRGIAVFSKHLSEVYLIDHIEFKDNDTVIDCGANVGELIPYFYNHSSSINYIGFEPDIKIFEALQKNFTIKDGNIFQVGLSDTEGVTKLYIDSDGADTSLEKSETNIYNKIEVKKLDSYKFQNVKLIKIDGEGHELEILLGAKKTLKKTKYVSIDHGPEKGINNLRTTPEVYLNLIENNFVPILTSSAREITLFKNNNL